MAVRTLSRIQAEQTQRLDRMRRWVIRYARKHLGCDQDMAEDLAQDTLCALCQAYPNLASDEVLQKVSRTTVRHFFFRRHRDEGNKTCLSLESLLEDQTIAPIELPLGSVHAQVEERETITRLQNAINALRPSFRAVILLVSEGRDGQEIAETLHISHGAVRARLSRARKSLACLLNSPIEHNISE